jgi:hypothetical protein
MPPPTARLVYDQLPHGPSSRTLALDLTPSARRTLADAADPASPHWWRELDGRANRALNELLRYWPERPPLHTRRTILETLAASPVLEAEGDRAVVQPDRLCEAAAELDPDGVWLATHGRCTPAALVALRQAAWLNLAVLPNLSPTSLSMTRVVLRTLARVATPDDLDRLARQIRGSLLARLGPTLSALQDDQKLIANVHAPEDPHLPPEDFRQGVAAAARSGQLDFAKALLERVHCGIEPDALKPSAATVTRAAALRSLIDSTTLPAGDEPLLISAADGSGELDWTIPAALSRRNDLEAQVARTLGTRDWTSFDSPGEGGWPSLWRDALILAGLWTPEWAARWEAHGAAPPETEDPYELLLGYPETASAVVDSPLSSYSQGLHEGTAESYGDVFSPRDPFSDRGD